MTPERIDPVEPRATAPDRTPQPEEPTASLPPASAIGMQLPSIDPRVVAGALGALLLAALLIVRPGLQDSPGPSGDVDGTVSIALPPVGTIWFGRTFNPTTFETSGRLSLAGTGDTIAFVGRVTRVTPAIGVRVIVEGVTTALPNTEIRHSRDMVAGTFELVDTGPLSIQIIDGRGSVLASGTFLVTN